MNRRYMTMKHCANCGETVDETATCPACGVDLTIDRGTGQREAVVCTDGGSNNDQVIAGILAILLGAFGVHKFYQGNMKLGIIYLCFCWTMIPSLLGLIEGIMMLIADEDEYQQKYADGSLLGR